MRVEKNPRCARTFFFFVVRWHQDARALEWLAVGDADVNRNERARVCVFARQKIKRESDWICSKTYRQIIQANFS